MKIALAQINPTVGDLEGNKAVILKNIEKAQKEGVDLIIFPELAVTGYPPRDLIHKKDFIRKNKQILLEITKKTNIDAIIGFIDKEKNNLYNAAAIISNQSLLGIQHKTLLPTYDVFNEERYFTQATEHQTFSLTRKTGVMICEDLWDSDYDIKVAELLQNADQIIAISASPYQYGKRKERIDLLKKKAKQLQKPFYYVNQVGGQDDLVFDGESLAVNENGELVAIGKKFEEDFIIVGSESKEFPKENETEEIYQALILGIRDYFHKSGIKKAMIGLSGGIDSAVTACLAVKALGKENVQAIAMPSQFSSGHSIEDAKQLAINLNIKHSEIPIEKIFTQFKNTLKEEFKNKKEDVTEENLQARIRGTLLMALANKFNTFVLTTGNKSEFSVGYSTLYGDMAGAFAPLIDVYKTQVYELAEYINKEEEIIPKNTIQKEPSAELRPNQKDADSLPDYKILDAILKAYIEDQKELKEIIEGGYEEKTVQWVIRQVDKSEFKRRQAPPGIKLSEKAFGSGRQMPIVNKYRG